MLLPKINPRTNGNKHKAGVPTAQKPKIKAKKTNSSDIKKYVKKQLIKLNLLQENKKLSNRLQSTLLSLFNSLEEVKIPRMSPHIKTELKIITTLSNLNLLIFFKFNLLALITILFFII